MMQKHDAEKKNALRNRIEELQKSLVKRMGLVVSSGPPI